MPGYFQITNLSLLIFYLSLCSGEFRFAQIGVLEENNIILEVLFTVYMHINTDYFDVSYPTTICINGIGSSFMSTVLANHNGKQSCRWSVPL